MKFIVYIKMHDKNMEYDSSFMHRIVKMLGFNNISEIHKKVETRYEISIEANNVIEAREAIEELCRKIFVDLIDDDYKIAVYYDISDAIPTKYASRIPNTIIERRSVIGS